MDIVDDYHGTLVPDPYRWTEDPSDPETIAFVTAQNEISLPYLASLPERHRLAERMTRLWDVARTGGATHRDGRFVYARNDGLQDQPVHFFRDGIDGVERLLLDPNHLSEDGAVAVVTSSLSPDGSLFAYSVAEAGSDWQVVRVRDVTSGSDLTDELFEVKFSSIAWYGSGFFYARFPGADRTSVGLTTHMSIYFHEIGSDQSADASVFANDAQPELGYDPSVTEDERHLVLTEWEGTSHKNGLLYRELPDGEWLRLRGVGEAGYEFLHSLDGAFLVSTDLSAPNGRVVRIALDDPAQMETVVAEAEDAVETALVAGEEILVTRLREAAHVIERFSLTGDPLGTIPLPGPGTLAEVSGRSTDPVVLLGWQSFTIPPSVYMWDGHDVTRFAGEEASLGVDVTREAAVSKDGTRVGMFLLRGSETTLPAPTIVYGYGGFNINLTPMFNPARLAFLEEGGVIAVTNLRGGNEWGERWHETGALGSKQNVFDDFVACARHLKATGTASKVGSRGGSNGGLLTAVTLLQSPDDFDAVVSQVPVTDMYRYQHFTAGRYWTVEYGDAANPEAFEWLSVYSPLHTSTPGIELPPVLITTAETDDRVVPMHSHKFAAALQHAAGGSSTNPILERIERRAGHGLGKPVSKLIEESADMFGFLLHHLS